MWWRGVLRNHEEAQQKITDVCQLTAYSDLCLFSYSLLNKILFYLNGCESFIWKSSIVPIIGTYMSGKIYLFGNWVLIAIVSHRNTSAHNIINLIYISAQSFEIHSQSRFNARYWMLGAGALGRSRGMVWGGRREEGSGWGTHVYLWWIHFDVWQN